MAKSTKFTLVGWLCFGIATLIISDGDNNTGNAIMIISAIAFCTSSILQEIERRP